MLGVRRAARGRLIRSWVGNGRSLNEGGEEDDRRGVSIVRGEDEEKVRVGTGDGVVSQRIALPHTEFMRAWRRLLLSSSAKPAEGGGEGDGDGGGSVVRFNTGLDNRSFASKCCASASDASSKAGGEEEFQTRQMFRG